VGLGAWGPTPNPQSPIPIPNPQSPKIFNLTQFILF